jgi:hypothetical protein
MHHAGNFSKHVEPADTPAEAAMKKLSTAELEALAKEFARSANAPDAQEEADKFYATHKDYYIRNKASAGAMYAYLVSKGYKEPFTAPQLRQAFEDLVDMNAIAFKAKPPKNFDEGSAYELTADELRMHAAAQLRGEI